MDYHVSTGGNIGLAANCNPSGISSRTDVDTANWVLLSDGCLYKPRIVSDPDGKVFVSVGLKLFLILFYLKKTLQYNRLNILQINL